MSINGMQLTFTIFDGVNNNTYSFNSIVLFNTETTNTDNYLYKLFKYIYTQINRAEFKWYVDIDSDEFIDWLDGKGHAIEELWADYSLECYYTDLFVDEMIDKLTDVKFESYDQITEICDFIENNSNGMVEWEDFTAKVV